MGEARPQQSEVLLRELLPSRAVPCRLATGRESQSRWLCRLPQLMQAPLCVVLIPVLDAPVLCPPLQSEALLGTQLIAQNSVVLSRWGTKYSPSHAVTTSPEPALCSPTRRQPPPGAASVKPHIGADEEEPVRTRAKVPCGTDRPVRTGPGFLSSGAEGASLFMF